MNQKFDDLTLSSYVDGELDPESMREVEAFLESDADARKYVVNAIKTTARLRQSFNKVLYEQVPEQLINTILSQPKKKGRLSTVFHPALRMAAASGSSGTSAGPTEISRFLQCPHHFRPATTKWCRKPWSII